MCDADPRITCVSQVRLQSQPKSLGMADIKGGIILILILIIAPINLILIIKIIISQFNDSYHHNH